LLFRIFGHFLRQTCKVRPVPVPRRRAPWFRIGARLDRPPCPQLPGPLSLLTATGRTLSRTCRSRWTASP
jgi:hypothetical protein